MKCRPIAGWSLALLVVAMVPLQADDNAKETIRYVRPAGEKYTTECIFVITKQKDGWTITSRTEHGTTTMDVVSRYDALNQLITARATLNADGSSKVAAVDGKGGKVIVKREGEKAVEFDVPKQTIVTSAPDWTDVFLLCRWYDRVKNVKQEFPALWIHPTQQPQRLTFSIEPQGTDRIEHDGKMIKLTRYVVRIRGNSGYVAWTDDRGRMIRLVPLTTKNPASGMMREGYEKSAAGLLPSK